MGRRVLYFGTIDVPGHYLWGTTCDVGICRMRGPKFSHLINLAERLAPADSEKEGRVLRHYVFCWTALSFWDRSIDHRPGSISTFFISGNLSYGDAMELAREAFPKVFERFEFKLCELVI